MELMITKASTLLIKSSALLVDKERHFTGANFSHFLQIRDSVCAIGDLAFRAIAIFAVSDVLLPGDDGFCGKKNNGSIKLWCGIRII